MDDPELRSLEVSGLAVSRADLPQDQVPERTDLLSIGGVAGWPRLADRARRLPAVRTLIGRPVPRTVVALVSALIAGAGVAVYLGAPEEGTTPAAEPVPILEPESWLEIEDGPVFFGPALTSLDQEWQALAEQELSRYGDATLSLVMSLHEARLLGVPPGRYRFQVSCVPVSGSGWTDPVGVEAYRNAGGIPDVLSVELPCDGEVHTAGRPMIANGYRAFTIFGYAATSTDPGGVNFDSQPVLVVSLVPEDQAPARRSSEAPTRGSSETY